MSIVHRCPRIGSNLTPCCNKTPFELPRQDCLTVTPALVTCPGYKPEPDELLAYIRELEERIAALEAS